MIEFSAGRKIGNVYKANLKKRFFASLMDYLIIFTLTYFYIDYFGHENNNGGKTVEGIGTLPIVIFWFFYFVFIEALFEGTLGHLALNLKVVTIKREKIGFIEALKRHLVDPLDFFFLLFLRLFQ